MALNTGKILMRRGQEVNFDPNKMTPGEWAVSLDNKYVRMCFQPGVCVRMATYDAFEADMVQIQRILAECQTVEEAVRRIYEEIKDVAVDVERIETAAANALKSEKNALNSANSASQSANTAVNKANEASESANTASAKAGQATEGARIATEKSNEAADSAENVRNMSDVSQSYAVGGTGTREGEDTDNAKYYNQQASDNADRAEEAAERASVVAGFGGTYIELRNKPTINGVELVGNKTLDELGIASKEALEETDNKVNIIIENAELRFKETASGEHIHLDDSADSKLVEFGLYGKAVQDGIPTPENPVEIEVAGNDGSVEVKSCGSNILNNNDYELGSYKNDGTLISDASIYRFNKEFLVIPNKTIYLLKKLVIYWYGDNSNFISMDSTGKLSLAVPQGAKYAKARIFASDFSTFNNNDYMVSRTPIAAHEPYKEAVSTIPTPNGLAGIPVDGGGNYTDENGQQWICDEIVKYADGSGEKIQRVEVIESYNSETITGAYVSTTGELSTGAKVIYQLSEPITTPLTAEQIAEIEKLSTFYPVTNISNDADCGMKVKYIADAKSYIDNRLAMLTNAIINNI